MSQAPGLAAFQSSQGDEDGVDSTSVIYDVMAEKWELLHDLLGGTKTMRDAGTKWLPKEPEEEDPTYSLRLNRSVLFNAYKDTVEKLTNKPFSRPVTLMGDLPETMSMMEDDVDRSGTNLTQFSGELFKAGITYGLTHILVDFTRVEFEVEDEDSPVAITLADERDAGARPMFIHVKPPQLLGWRSEKIAGIDVLTQVRIHETRIEPVGMYGDMQVEFVRVYSINTWELHRRSPRDKKWTMVANGTHTFNAVPLVTLYVDKTGFLQGSPPLEDLAWLNVAHWQSQSDQRNILRFARTALLFARGLTDEDMEKKITLGPNRLFRTTSSTAEMKYVEHTGKAIAAGERDLSALEGRMEVLGLQPFMEQGRGKTATGRIIDEGKTISGIQAWIRNEENALTEAFKLASRWTKTELDENFGVNIFNEFGLAMHTQEDIQALIRMREKGQISSETFLNEIKRRGMISDTVDLTEERERLARDLSPSLFEGDEGSEEDEDED